MKPRSIYEEARNVARALAKTEAFEPTASKTGGKYRAFLIADFYNRIGT
jgi:hypothetical protein